jgi:hypothetical protein
MTTTETTAETTIRNCKLQWSGGRMPPGIVAKLEGSKALIDEQQADKRQSYRDKAGAVSRVRQDADGTLRADLTLNPGHALAPQISWDAANNPAALALKIGKGPGDKYFVAIVATTDNDNSGGLFESADSQPFFQGDANMALIRNFQKARAAGLSIQEAARLAESMDASDRHTATATRPAAPVLQESGVARFLDQDGRARYRKRGGRLILDRPGTLQEEALTDWQRRHTAGANRLSLAERIARFTR